MEKQRQSYLVIITTYLFITIFIYTIVKDKLVYNNWFILGSSFGPSFDTETTWSQFDSKLLCVSVFDILSLFMMLIFPATTLTTKRLLLWFMLNGVISISLFLTSVCSLIYMYAYDTMLTNIMKLSFTVYFTLAVVLSFTLLIYNRMIVHVYNEIKKLKDEKLTENTTLPLFNRLPEDKLKTMQTGYKRTVCLIGAIVYAPLFYHILYMYARLGKYVIPFTQYRFNRPLDEFFQLSFFIIPLVLTFLYVFVKRSRHILKYILCIFNIANWIICTLVIFGT